MGDVVDYQEALDEYLREQRKQAGTKMSVSERGTIMKGKDLIKWIEENGAEEHIVIANTEDHRYLKAVDIWEGESDGGSIMIDVVENACGGTAQ